jgi:hypothetical protein
MPMKSSAKLTQAEMILLAIYRASDHTTSRVAFESIVLRVWNDFPQHFSLNNHPEHPDSYPVSKRLHSDLITRRLVVSLRKQVFRLTGKGLRVAEQLENKSQTPDAITQNLDHRLSKEEKEFIEHALRSRTYLAWKRGKGSDLIDYDARVFFQFSTGTPIRERKRKVDNAKEAIETGIASGLREAESLRNLVSFLIGKFPGLFEEI